MHSPRAPGCNVDLKKLLKKIESRHKPLAILKPDAWYIDQFNTTLELNASLKKKKDWKLIKTNKKGIFWNQKTAYGMAGTVIDVKMRLQARLHFLTDSDISIFHQGKWIKVLKENNASQINLILEKGIWELTFMARFQNPDDPQKSCLVEIYLYPFRSKN